MLAHSHSEAMEKMLLINVLFVFTSTTVLEA